MSLTTRTSASEILMTNFASQTLTNSTTETALFSSTVPGGVLSTNRSLRITMNCALTSVLTPPTITIKFKYGSFVVTAISGIAIVVNQTAKPFSIDVMLTNRDSASSQFALCTITNPSTVTALTGLAVMEQIIGTASIDSTVDQTVQITAQFGTQISNTSLVTQYIRTSIE